MIDPVEPLGKLQRGLGAGYLWAVGTDRDHALELLKHCIAENVREDRQLDERAEYHARLAIALELGVTSDMPLDVLGRMAAHRHAAARQALRERVAHGPDWARAVDALAYDWERFEPVPDWTDAVDGLDRVVRARYPDPDVLAAEAEATGVALWHPPWPAWGIERPRRPRGPASTAKRCAATSVEGRSPAELIELAEAGLQVPRALYGAVSHALVALPFSETAETARRWLRDGGPHRRRAARILAAHAGAADVAAIRAALTRELDLEAGADDQYVICSLAEALGRNPDGGPYPELRRAYEEMRYSFGRKFVVQAIAATDPAFPAELAPECRHDCQREVRELAGRAAGQGLEPQLPEPESGVLPITPPGKGAGRAV